MARYVMLGNGRQVSLASYVVGIKLAKDNPEAWFKDGLNGWGQYGSEIMASFRRGVQERINHGVPRTQQWHSGETVWADDLRQQEKRIQRKLWAVVQRDGRNCKWCGQHFIPESLNQHCCDSQCARAYRGY